MIGQDTLINIIDSYSINTLPHSLLFVGQAGAGKHSIVKYISGRFNLPIVDVASIDSKLLEDSLIDFTNCPINKIYLVDFDAKAGAGYENFQAKFLKLIEETPQNMYIIMLAQSKASIIDTILNRCVAYDLAHYSEAQLRQINGTFINLVYKVCTTPGQLLTIDNDNINNLYTECRNIITHIKTLGIGDLLSILTKINFSEEYNKYDFTLFINMMLYISSNNFITTNNDTAYKIYKVTKKLQTKLTGKALIKERVMTEYLIDLWRTCR